MRKIYMHFDLMQRCFVGKIEKLYIFTHLHVPETVIVITIIIAGHQVTEISPFYLYGKKSLYQRRGVHFDNITIIAITSS